MRYQNAKQARLWRNEIYVFYCCDVGQRYVEKGADYILFMTHSTFLLNSTGCFLFDNEWSLKVWNINKWTHYLTHINNIRTEVFTTYPILLIIIQIEMLLCMLGHI